MDQQNTPHPIAKHLFEMLMNGEDTDKLVNDLTDLIGEALEPLGDATKSGGKYDLDGADDDDLAAKIDLAYKGDPAAVPLLKLLYNMNQFTRAIREGWMYESE